MGFAGFTRYLYRCPIELQRLIDVFPLFDPRLPALRPILHGISNELFANTLLCDVMWSH